MENRIQEQLLLFAERTSTALRRSNPVRLYFSAVASGLLQALRRLGLEELADYDAATSVATITTFFDAWPAGGGALRRSMRRDRSGG